ncbi:MAG: glucokinase [Gemmatimonadales bacterium]
MQLLAGDIGGTKTRLVLLEQQSGGNRVVHEERYPSNQFPGLGPIVTRFLREAGGRPGAACFGIAGPVVERRVQATNLAWVVDQDELRDALGIPVRLINDFAAIGHGIPHLKPADVTVLQSGRADEHGVIAYLGAGTGLGQGFLVWNGDRYQVHSSEGGHASFASMDGIEDRLAGALRERFGHVSWERLLSGAGLVAIYRFLSGEDGTPGPARAEIDAADDPAPVISSHALAGTDPHCVRALEVFVSIYGAQAGNLALTFLATGGVYVAGGIAPKILARLVDGPFLDAFRSKGRMKALLARIPVKVITNTDVGLLGAAAVAGHVSRET